MAKWFVAAKKADFDAIAKEYGITPVLARLIRNREVIEPEEIQKYLHGSLKDLYDPFLMKDMKKAVSILMDKILDGEKIRIIGDYDVDGICATYILLRGLRALDANVDTVIPDRIKDGYGLNEHLIEQARNEAVDTILTCDNGIAATEQISMAVSCQMTVIVTDHHEVPFDETAAGREYHLPPAAAVIDPKQEDCTYPFPKICGAVVAYKLIQALFQDWEEESGEAPAQKEELLQELLGFGALATVCDMMELKDENRILVREGLKVMEHTSNMGLQALLEVNGLADKPLTPYHMGFVIGPCLNATGRLDTAARALELFTSRNWGKAVELAADLKNLNDSRKDMTARGVEEAIAQVESRDWQTQKVLIIYLPECHESLAGIIAGRIREKYNRPVFVLTDGEEGVKGSGRSIEAYDMYAEMSRCKDLFTRYGGHKLAAGLSMPRENIEPFQNRLLQNCTLTEADFEERVHIDVPMPLVYADLKFAKELELLEPFGNGNSKPLFAQKNLKVLQETILGKNRNVGKYQLQDENGKQFEAIYFGNLPDFQAYLQSKKQRNITIAYYPSINSYQGVEKLQFVIQNYC